MQPGQMAYDRGITVFSPDGRLFQVEYAREAVKKGTTTIGLKFRNGVMIIVDKRVASKLVEPESIQKIYDIDEHIGCATSGLVADARVLVDEARRDAQIHKITYGENVTVEVLTKQICDLKQSCTQVSGRRPFGTALLIAGVDELGTHLFETDPSGALVAYKATCIGAGRPVVMDFFEREYKDNMGFEAALKMGFNALIAALEEDLDAKSVEVGIVKGDDKFRRLSEEEVSKVISKL